VVLEGENHMILYSYINSTNSRKSVISYGHLSFHTPLWCDACESMYSLHLAEIQRYLALSPLIIWVSSFIFTYQSLEKPI